MPTLLFSRASRSQKVHIDTHSFWLYVCSECSGTCLNPHDHARAFHPKYEQVEVTNEYPEPGSRKKAVLEMRAKA